VPRNFNPYQTIISNQIPDILGENNTVPWNLIQEAEANFLSGKVLGVEQGIIDKEDVIYDGFGRISDLQYVNFKYDIEWQNISSYRDNPFWVITKIESFDSSLTVQINNFIIFIKYLFFKDVLTSFLFYK